MSKRIKVFLSALALFFIVVSILAVRWDLMLWNWSLEKIDQFYIMRENSKLVDEAEEVRIEEDGKKEEKNCPDLKDAPTDLSVFSPVEKEFLEAALFDAEDPRGIAFFLPSETSIKSAFLGKVKEVLHDHKPFVDESQFEQIVLEKDGGEILATYLIEGNVLVKEGDWVKEGITLAKSGEEGVSLYFWLNDENGDFIKLSKKMFK